MYSYYFVILEALCCNLSINAEPGTPAIATICHITAEHGVQTSILIPNGEFLSVSLCTWMSFAQRCTYINEHSQRRCLGFFTNQHVSLFSETINFEENSNRESSTLLAAVAARGGGDVGRVHPTTCYTSPLFILLYIFTTSSSRICTVKKNILELFLKSSD